MVLARVPTPSSARKIRVRHTTRAAAERPEQQNSAGVQSGIARADGQQVRYGDSSATSPAAAPASGRGRGGECCDRRRSGVHVHTDVLDLDISTLGGDDQQGGSAQVHQGKGRVRARSPRERRRSADDVPSAVGTHRAGQGIVSNTSGDLVGCQDFVRHRRCQPTCECRLRGRTTRASPSRKPTRSIVASTA